MTDDKHVYPSREGRKNLTLRLDENLIERIRIAAIKNKLKMEQMGEEAFELLLGKLEGAQESRHRLEYDREGGETRERLVIGDKPTGWQREGDILAWLEARGLKVGKPYSTGNSMLIRDVFGLSPDLMFETKMRWY